MSRIQNDSTVTGSKVFHGFCTAERVYMCVYRYRYIYIYVVAADLGSVTDTTNQRKQALID